MTGVMGVATFTDLTITTVGEGYVLRVKPATVSGGRNIPESTAGPVKVGDTRRSRSIIGGEFTIELIGETKIGRLTIMGGVRVEAEIAIQPEPGGRAGDRDRAPLDAVRAGRARPGPRGRWPPSR